MGLQLSGRSEIWPVWFQSHTNILTRNLAYSISGEIWRQDDLMNTWPDWTNTQDTHPAFRDVDKTAPEEEVTNGIVMLLLL